MNDAFFISGIGLSSQQQALDVIANNIANLNTQSFKRADVEFSELLSSRLSDAGVSADGVQVKIGHDWDIQGEIVRTEHELDVAIDGRGFIELMGDEGQSFLWRGGRLQVNELGYLTADNGMPLRSMINVPMNISKVIVQQDGMVLGRGSDAEPLELGRINIVQPVSGSDMSRVDGGYYRVPNDVQLFEAGAGADGVGLILQGAVEKSNVDLNQEMVSLLITQRAYAANAQVLQAADEVMSIANNLRR